MGQYHDATDTCQWNVVDGAKVESFRFHERLGFDVVWTMPEIGRKLDRWLDLVLVQRIIR